MAAPPPGRTPVTLDDSVGGRSRRRPVSHASSQPVISVTAQSSGSQQRSAKAPPQSSTSIPCSKPISPPRRSRPEGRPTKIDQATTGSAEAASRQECTEVDDRLGSGASCDNMSRGGSYRATPRFESLRQAPGAEIAGGGSPPP